ncbi:unnamed protein product [Caenorhabditis auriculariae]|uniref:Uncharacterized protein n=1 Tax=Caenorhabditis auriculariae TaxID=2777116 RepID=A0A8S1H360_9PELO|nr:unnamed protein product [Caenorhabditis auriculariae]
MNLGLITKICVNVFCHFDAQQSSHSALKPRRQHSKMINLFVILMHVMTAMFLATTAICCHKKSDEAGKLKPRDLSSAAAKQSTAEPKEPGKEGEKTGGTASKSVAAPVSKGPAPMPQREADDNETINDAKSDWGAVPQ